MKKIGIVTDSSGDIPLSYYSSIKNIIMLPLNVRLGLEAFTDAYDISSELQSDKIRYTLSQFYQEMRKQEHVPCTVPVTVSNFLSAFEELSKECDVILAIHFSNHLGYTVKAAEIAASKFKACKVIVIDTLQISNGYGAIIKETVRLRENGASLDELVSFVNSMKKSLDQKLIMTNQESKYLYRCGRINFFVLILANLIQLKSFTLKNGKVTPLFNFRGKKGVNKALNESLALVKNAISRGKRAYFIVSDADNEIGANLIIQRLEKENIEYERRYMGPITGVYGGPGLSSFMPIIIE